ncbi:MAG TPA: hypothetical protein VNW97_20190 [Candidatus Saccharimonadales bacterium]|jgi:hypothetical protein|nr:hypothetical protein [Candidatus Saccharimonadales bacterium]
MKQFLHAIDYLLWGLIIVGELTLFAGAIRRHLNADFPRFVLLLCFICVRSIVLVFVNFQSGFQIYFYTYYWGVGIEAVLLVLVASEIFQLVFEPVSALPGHVLSRMAGAVIGIAAMLVAVVISGPFRGSGPATPVLYGARMAVEAVLCSAFWLLALYSRFMGLPWQSRAADILSGFLFYMTIQAMTHALVWIAPHSYSALISRIESAAYLGGLGFWFAALRRQEPTFAAATQGQLLLLRVHIQRLHSEMARLDALEIQDELSRALPPPGTHPKPQTFDELLTVLRRVEFPEYEPVSYRQMLALRREIRHNCEWLLRFVRDQYRPLVRQLELLGEVETLQGDVLRAMAECRKVFFGFSRQARLRRLRRLAKLYHEVQLAAMLLCDGAQPYLMDDLSLAL